MQNNKTNNQAPASSFERKGFAKEQISLLAEKYKKLVTAGEIKSYNEARTRNEFIEPLFEFLGWDMRNLNNENEVRPEEQK